MLPGTKALGLLEMLAPLSELDVRVQLRALDRLAAKMPTASSGHHSRAGPGAGTPPEAWRCSQQSLVKSQVSSS